LISGDEGNGRRITRRRGGGRYTAFNFVALSLALALPALCADSWAASPSYLQAPLHTITTAKEAHDLSASEATRGYPIHLRAVVTYFDPFLDARQIVVFLHDATGGIFLSLQGDENHFPAGTLVDVKGVSGMGDFAPIIMRPHVTALGHSHLPTVALPVSLTRLLTGDEDGQWVQVEGIIHSVFETDHNIVMQVAMRDGLISATFPREDGRDYGHLVDSRVRINANAGPIFNGDGQMIGARLMSPGLSSVTILEPGPKDAFDLPLRSITSLSRYTSVAELPRRIHVRGRVTLLYPGSLICIRDAAHGLCARTAQQTALNVGEMADVIGFAEIGGNVPSLSDAIYRGEVSEGLGVFPVAAMMVTPLKALYGKHDSELVRMEGQLIGRDLAAADLTLILASEGYVYSVVLPKSMVGADSDHWKNGSRLQVTGICSIQIDTRRTARESGAAVRESFRILLRSPQDVVVLERPSWWTPAHTLVLLTILLTVTLSVLIWVVVLTRRLKQQTQLIRGSEEQFRHMAQHDSLTGLPSRLLLHDRLDAAFERAKRSGTGLALLMLDLDNFKHINDSLGHHVGDQALKIAANRIKGAVRGSDMVARISGDEFVVLITQLHQPHEAELVAAKIVAALSAPFHVGDREVPLSASVGVCTAFGGGYDADSLLKSVDTAMYHAKSQGRNRFQLYTAEMARSSEQHQRLRRGLERGDRRERAGGPLPANG
jgi:diguanylate cyclase (GGDEF)-like protein